MAVALTAHGAARPAPLPAGPALETGHPLLERHHRSRAESVFVTALARGRQWLLDEHVVRGASALIPGTGHLEIARAALEASAEPALPSAATGAPRPRAVEIRDLVFLSPLAVSPGETRTMRVTLDRATSELTIASASGDQGPLVTHVTAKVAHVEVPPPRSVDLEELRRRCRAREEARDGFMDQRFMDFGPRWGNLRRIAYGEGEALVELELPEAYAEDRAVYELHPALLDMATGAAQGLIPGFDRARDFYVPFSYGRVLVRGALPRRLWSHVRLGDIGGKGTASFHVTLLDDRGTEVAQITDFVMRRVDDRAVMAGAPVAAAPPQHASGAALAVLREGMLPAEGLDALDRIFASAVPSRIAATSIDLDDWRAAAASRPSGPAKPGDEAAAPRASRAGLGAAFVAPRDDLERSIADIWQKMLGLDEVGVNDDFFEIGGYSLLLTQTVTRIRRTLGVDIPLRSLLARPTISEIAAEIRKVKAGGGPRTGPSMTAVPRDAYRVKRSAVTGSLTGKKPDTE